MSASPVVYDKELSYAEENNDNGDGDGNNDNDDAEDTRKFATPTSKQGTAFSQEMDSDVYALWRPKDIRYGQFSTDYN